MKERTLASQFRRELKEWDDSILVQAHIDARNTQQKPYDTYMLRNGRFCAIEFKLIRGGTINCSEVTSGQLNGLTAATKAQGSAAIVLFLEKAEYKKAFITFQLLEWLTLFPHEENSGIWTPTDKTSMKIAGVEKWHFTHREKLRCGTTWDFSHFFDLVY